MPQPWLFGKIYSKTMNLLLGASFKFSQDAVGCHHRILATSVPMSLSCHTSHYYSSQSSQLGNNVNDSSHSQ